MPINPSLAPAHDRADTKLALNALRAATALILATDHPTAWEKNEQDWVTDTDLAAEDTIRRALEPAGYAFLGEETGGQLSPATPTWVVDPIDGTANFATGNPLVAVMIARIPPNQVTADLALVAHPYLGEEYIAWAGHGAYRGTTPLRCRTTPPDIVVTHTGSLPRIPSNAQVRILGSAGIDTCWVAAGRYSAACYTGDVHLWDIAPGALLVTEAGGHVISDAHNSTTLSHQFTAGTPTIVHSIQDHTS